MKKILRSFAFAAMVFAPWITFGAGLGTGTLTLKDNYVRDWKATHPSPSSVTIPLVIVDERDNPLDGFDVTFVLGDGANEFRDAGYALDALGTIVRSGYWYDGQPFNRSVFSVLGKETLIASDGAVCSYLRTQVIWDGTARGLLSETNPGYVECYDLFCNFSSAASYSENYGWKCNVITYPGGSSYAMQSIDPARFAIKLVYRRCWMPKNDGITMRLFDYGDAVNDNGLAQFFGFRSGGGGINQNTDADGYTENRAKVLPALDSAGFPVFDGRGYCENTSLRYLFDSDAPGKGVTPYIPANDLLLYKDGYYVYNSMETACDYDTANNLFIIRSYPERSNEMASYCAQSGYDLSEFLPFNACGGNVKGRNGNYPYHYNVGEINFWYGFTLAFEFTMKDVTAAGDSPVFRISGDDDIWIFVDDVLVIDLGGTHGMCTGEVDFKTGNVSQHLDWLGTLTPSYPTTLAQCFQAAGRTPVGGWREGGQGFVPGSVHTLKMFYLERGKGVSTCNFRFNLELARYVQPAGLCITDHSDAGEDMINLAFKPFFDTDVNLTNWVDVAYRDGKINLELSHLDTAEPARILRPGLRDGTGLRDATNGVVWLTFNLFEKWASGNNLLCKVVLGDPEFRHPADVVTINEFMASNDGSLKTAAGADDLDWIELRNTGDVDIDVSGWCLFDDPTKAKGKWATIQGNAVVPAHGYLIVWADKDYAGFTEDEAWVAIGLSTDGEPLFLADPQGNFSTKLDFPPQLKGVSYGLDKRGDWGHFRVPTPGAENAGTSLQEMTPTVAFGEPRGYKSEAFSLTLSCPQSPESSIRYTLDGSTPTLASAEYTDPIPVSKTTCVRAAVVNPRSVLQNDSAATYIFVDDVLSQSPSTVPAGFPGDRAVRNHHMVYGMRADVVDAERERLANGFTNGIASLSIVIDPKDLFDPNTGVYVNCEKDKDGKEWERKMILEQIDPVRGKDNEFWIPAGLRLRGSHCRDVNYPKHSFRFFFRTEYGRSEYGAGSLEFPLFGKEGADSFEKVDLRTSQNYSWANERAVNDTFVHETFERDAQRDLGVYYTRSRYYHLFINGQYWGLYQTQERADEDFAETYDRGKASDYDVIKTTGDSNVAVAVEGTDEAWNLLWTLGVNQGVSGAYAANYLRLQGFDADGTRNPDYPVLLSPYNLMVYMLVGHYTVDGDCPVSVWGGHPNNIIAIRNRNEADSKQPGFFFFRHDGEMCMGSRIADTRLPYADYRRQYCLATCDPTGYGFNGSFTSRQQFNPAELHGKLCANDDYRMAFADLVYSQCLKPGGALTDEASLARFRSRMAEIDDAIACEAARWARDGQTRQTWLDSCDECVYFITNRLTNMIAQYRNKGWYPSIDAPTVTVTDGKATFSAANPVYYTLDGSDPRKSDSALVAPAEGVALPAVGTTVVRARCKSLQNEWSALEETTFVGRDPVMDAAIVSHLRVAEVMNAPLEGGTDGAEYIVLTNCGDSVELSLDGVYIACWKDGKSESDASLKLTLPAGLSLAPGASVKLDKATYWPGAKITDGAVNAVVRNGAGDTAQTLFFSASWWGGACKGTGASLVALDFGETVTEESQWRPSTAE